MSPPRFTCFLRQYDTLNRILGEVEMMAEHRTFAAAAERFEAFRRALERHFSDEQDVLLPHFMKHASAPGEAVERILDARAQILRDLGEVGAALASSDYARFCVAMTALDRSLDAHRLDEEQVVHPALDAILKTDADWDRLRSQKSLNT